MACCGPSFPAVWTQRNPTWPASSAGATREGSPSTLPASAASYAEASASVAWKTSMFWQTRTSSADMFCGGEEVPPPGGGGTSSLP